MKVLKLSVELRGKVIETDVKKQLHSKCKGNYLKEKPFWHLLLKATGGSFLHVSFAKEH